MQILRIDPIDVLYLRGNRLFAEAGDAEAEMPPWPSVFAGAIRSRMLADFNALGSFRAEALGGELGEVLGSSASAPGTFRLAFSCLQKDGEPILPLPADLVVHGSDPAEREVLRMAPYRLSGLGLHGSFERPTTNDADEPSLPATPILRTPAQTKPEGGFALSLAGFRSWQQGKTPGASELVRLGEIWQSDPRLGIALSRQTRTAEDGMLYTSRVASFAEGAGFCVGLSGVRALAPTSGLLRLGGDGRGAEVREFPPLAVPAPWQTTPRRDSFTMVLSSPGIFPDGWLPTGATVEEDRWIWRWGDFAAEIVAASTPRPRMISGWDLAKRAPKPAVRVMPAGAVYWMRRRAGSLTDLSPLLETGLWTDHDIREPRRAEGFNSVWFGDWEDPQPTVEG